MRGHKRLFGALVALMATIAMVCSMAGSAYADRYSYTVRVFQGNGGKLKSDPVSVKVDKGGRVDLFDFATADVSDSKYVQIGFRLSGEDEIIGNGKINGVIEHGQANGKYGSGITQDMDFVVAYGVKGETVEYTLRFVEYGTGRELAEPQTYYGRVGDKPVVAYEYIEGYRPLYLSITGTLKKDAENVWTFEYVALQQGETFTPGTTTTNTTERTVPGNETVTNEGTTYEPGTTTTTTRTETVPGTTTNEPTTTTGTTTSPSTTGGTTTTSPTSTGGGTTTSPSGTTTTTTTTVPTNTTTTTNAGGNTATSTPSNAGGNDAASTAPSGAGNAGDAGNAGNAGATANDGGGAGTGGGAADGGNAGAAAQESAPATQEILDMDTPLAGPSSSDTGSLADAATSNTHTNSYARAGILLALLIAAALAAGFYIWKRKQEDSEDEPEPEE